MSQPDSGIKIDLPDGWTTLNPPQAGAALQAIEPAGHGFRSTMTMHVFAAEDQEAGPPAIDALHDAQIADLINTLPSAQRLEDAPTSVNGFHARCAVIGFRRDEYTLLARVWTVQVYNGAIQIAGICDAQRVTEIGPLINASVDSLVVAGGEDAGLIADARGATRLELRHPRRRSPRTTAPAAPLASNCGTRGAARLELRPRRPPRCARLELRLRREYDRPTGPRGCALKAARPEPDPSTPPISATDPRRGPDEEPSRRPEAGHDPAVRDWGGHVIVCGLHDVALRTVEQLYLAGIRVVVVDDEPEPRLVAAVKAWGIPYIARSALLADPLQEAGLAGAAAVICAESSDLGTLETALQVRSLRPDVRLVVHLDNPAVGGAVEGITGVGSVLDVAGLFAPSVVDACLGRTAHDLELDGQHFLVAELTVDRAGTLRELYGDLAPMAILSPQEELLAACPGRDAPVRAGDRVTLLGTPRDFADAGLHPAQDDLAHATTNRSRWRRIRLALQDAADYFDGPVRATLWVGLIVALISTVILRQFYVDLDAPNRHMTWIEAFYFTIETSATVGFGDFSFARQSPGLQAFAVALIIAGTAVVSLLFAFITNSLVSRRIEASLGRARVRGTEGHVILVGLGAVGMRVLEGVRERGREVVVIERDEDNRYASQARLLGVRVIIGDARSPARWRREHRHRLRGRRRDEQRHDEHRDRPRGARMPGAAVDGGSGDPARVRHLAGPPPRGDVRLPPRVVDGRDCRPVVRRRRHRDGRARHVLRRAAAVPRRTARGARRRRARRRRDARARCERARARAAACGRRGTARVPTAPRHPVRRRRPRLPRGPLRGTHAGAARRAARARGVDGVGGWSRRPRDATTASGDGRADDSREHHRRTLRCATRCASRAAPPLGAAAGALPR